MFDPDWDVTRRCGEKVITEDSLSRTMAAAVEHRLPMLFTLNGGIWADAACDIPAWDINDRLEQDIANCQWNEKNEVMPDDYLKHLPGSQDAPELARSLTFNVYAKDVRHYKRRNLAGRREDHPAIRARRTRISSSASTSIRTRTSIRSSISSSGTTTTRAR